MRIIKSTADAVSDALKSTESSWQQQQQWGQGRQCPFGPALTLCYWATLTVKAKASTHARETEIPLLGHIQAGLCSPFPVTGAPLLLPALHPAGTQIPPKQQRFSVLFSQHPTRLAL